MSEKPPLTLTTEDGEGGLVARIAGEMNAANSPPVRAQLLEAIDRSAPAVLVVDLRDVGFMDSAGVAVLVEALRKQHQAGRGLRLRGVQPRVRAMLEIARLDTLFPVEDEEPGS